MLNRSEEHLVRLQMRLARKRYLNSKRVYEYERISLHIPKKLHEVIKPYLDRDLDLKVTVEKDSLIISLTPSKMFRHEMSMKSSDNTLK